MEEGVARVAEWISNNAALAAPVIGLLAFGESLVVIGMFIPATALMVAVGGLIGTGTLAPFPVLACAICGAALGDWLSYLLGRRIGPSVYRRWPLRDHRTAVARARLFFRRYGIVSIFLGRFFGPVRATVPLVAGVMGMKSRPFQIANVSSAIVWVPVLFAPGYLAANSFDLARFISGEQLVMLGVALLVLPLAGGWVASKMFERRRALRRGRARMLGRDQKLARKPSA